MRIIARLAAGPTSNRDPVAIAECGEVEMKRRTPHPNEILLCKVFIWLCPNSNMLMAYYGTFEPKSEPIVESSLAPFDRGDSNPPRFKPAVIGPDTCKKEIRVIEIELLTGSLDRHQTGRSIGKWALATLSVAASSTTEHAALRKVRNTANIPVESAETDCG